jgi:hypothetical protein
LNLVCFVFASGRLFDSTRPVCSMSQALPPDLVSASELQVAAANVSFTSPDELQRFWQGKASMARRL